MHPPTSIGEVRSFLGMTRYVARFLVDPSPVGVGAVLTQNGKILYYASRALTDVEQQYSQT